MTRDFQKLMKQFQEIQRKSLDKCREFVIRAQAIRDSGKTSPTPIADEAENAPLVSGNGQEYEFDILVPLFEFFVGANRHRKRC
jgi:hypothetical protein